MDKADKAPPVSPIRLSAEAESTPQGPKLGECLRRLRFERRLSITDVAAATGISQSTLSRVERDQLSLTYDKLVQLCRGLNVDLAALFSADSAAQRPRELGRRTVTLPGAGRKVTVSAQEYLYLCTELAGKKMTPQLCVVNAHSLAESHGLTKHEGEEFGYVLEGTVQLHTEFYEPLTLPTGASVYFDSTMPHVYVSVGSEPARLLCVCSTPDPIFLESAKPADPMDSSSQARPTHKLPKRTRRK